MAVSGSDRTRLMNYRTTTFLPMTQSIEICSLCAKPGVIDVRRDRLYKGVLIENLPAKHCPNCHEEYYELETVRLMEQIASDPERYAQMIERPVARVA